MARWRSRCAERGLRQASGVAARSAAGCLRLQSFICCGSNIPQVWPGMSSAGLEARRAGMDGIHSVLGGRRGSGENRFMVGGGRPKAGHVGFLVVRRVFIDRRSGSKVCPVSIIFQTTPRSLSATLLRARVCLWYFARLTLSRWRAVTAQ